MTNWRVTLNRPHVALWTRGGVWWLTLIVMALILGPRARLDEVLFALVLPLAVLVPYAAGTLILAWAKALLLPWLRRCMLVADNRDADLLDSVRRGKG
jgi:hypothetical protein